MGKIPEIDFAEVAEGNSCRWHIVAGIQAVDSLGSCSDNAFATLECYFERKIILSSARALQETLHVHAWRVGKDVLWLCEYVLNVSVRNDSQGYFTIDTA